MPDAEIGVNLVSAEVAVSQEDAAVEVTLVETSVNVDGGEIAIEVSVPNIEVLVELSGPPGPAAPSQQEVFATDNPTLPDAPSNAALLIQSGQFADSDLAELFFTDGVN